MSASPEPRPALLDPVLRDPGAGDLFPYFDAHLERVIARSETYDALNVLRLTLTPDGAPPLHMHTREDETWVVLDGEVKFWTGGQNLAACDTGVLGSGGVAYGPRLVPHTFQSQTPTAEVLIITTPGFFEDHMLAIGTTAQSKYTNTVEEIAKFGVTVLDRPPVYGQD
ncbi:cupin domain-containing protein [Mycobacterium sp. 1274756.6]|uniref:cupin domain-containing protein n=1 Tax=Mycobacterium sp. 1274756.6 TaxID=1834076 RepID=UPI0007FD8DF1|nr:cupin domain-containing protein [Mycobacterium sp. 1274756.6]OBJ69085.1 hypothetical protein A5643_12685 [Mycobacterium sp. 1274756.6]